MIICDVDNVLADDAWRLPYIRYDIDDLFTRYDYYHKLSLYDTAHNQHLVAVKEDVILLTSMPCIYRPIRERWLRLHGIGYRYLLMRPYDNHEHAVDCKRGLLEKLFEIWPRPYMVSAAYDDRPDVVEMYHEHFGFFAQQVYITEQPDQWNRQKSSRSSTDSNSNTSASG